MPPEVLKGVETVIQAVVFDFDLTLVDSSRGIWMTLNELAREKNLRPLELGEVKVTIGRALRDAMVSFWGPLQEDWINRYRQIFVEKNYWGIEAFPETFPALEILKSRRIKLGVATNRLDPEAIVRASGVMDWCPVVVGIQNLPPKPEPDIVLEALRRLDASPRQSVYVGDTDIDMNTACAAGVIAVGVTTGNHDGAALKAAGADYLLTSLADLPSLVETL